MEAEVLVHVTRASIIESVHRGHVAVVNYHGDTLWYAGNPQLKTFARSTAKLIQTIPVIESGAAEHYGLTDEEIAILCASHSGEAQHVETVQRILAKLKVVESVLQCGPHDPFHKKTAAEMKANRISTTCLHNNCSGKHSGMIALALYLNSTLDTYMSPDHPVQRMMLRTVSEMAGVPESDITLGVDGCGVPVYGLPLNHLALAFARLGKPDLLSPERADACRRIMQSVSRHPFFIAGTDRFDTLLIKTTDGRIVGKMGAEGVFAISIPEKGLGIAIKVEDGSQRALYPSVVEALKQLDLLLPSELSELKAFHSPAVTNWSGTVVGATNPVLTLHPA